MNQYIETFPGLTFTSDIAFSVLKVMLQPLKIDLTAPPKTYYQPHRFERKLGDYRFIFILEMNGLLMPQLAVTSDCNRPLATIEFEKDGIHVSESQRSHTDNVIVLEPAVTTCFAVIKHILQHAWLYLAEHYRRLV